MNGSFLRQPTRRALALGLLSTLVAAPLTHAGDYQTQVVASGLDRPTGILALSPRLLVITQLPTPGVPGSQGGENTVDLIRLAGKPGHNRIWNLTTGEPEPTHLARDRHWNLYWTCKSAGVILQRNWWGEVSLFLGDLEQPSGIAVDHWNNVYFTQLPTPGVPGSMGGMNTVNVSDGDTIEVLTMGEPEPTDIVVSRNGTAFWTCKSAGVILMRTTDGEVSLVLDKLNQPTGIALDHRGRELYFTEVPTPGVSGSMGGQNRVSVLDLHRNRLHVVDEGDPEPTDISVAPNGSVFWTCTSAGVIVEAREKSHGHPRWWKY
jgi:hypothetical protein